MYSDVKVSDETDCLRRSLAGFEIHRLNYTLRPLGALYLGEDAMKGDKFRGGLGWALKKTLCTNVRANDCRICRSMKTDCRYYSYFITDKPRPFVLHIDNDTKKTYSSEERLQLTVILFGSAARFKHDFTIGLGMLGSSGIGKGRCKFVIENIEETLLNNFDKLFNADISGDDYVTIEFLKPVKLIEQGKQIQYTDLPFHVLFRHLLRRIINLNNLYGEGLKCDKNNMSAHYSSLVEKAGSIQTIQHTRWKDYERYSARQKTSMKVGGQTGYLEISGDIESIYPYLKIGDVTGVGQYTTSGFGRYRLSINDQPRSESTQECDCE